MRVECELGEGKPFDPVILSVRTESAEILFYLLVHMLCLSIGLGMIGYTGIAFNSHLSVNFFGEGGYEGGASVRPYALRQAVRYNYVLDEESCLSFRV